MKKLYFIVLRYLVILIFGLGNLFIFYLLLAPLTIYPSFFVLDKLYGAVLIQGREMVTCNILSNIGLFADIACIKTTILFKDYYASIIPACIAGSAYYLLLILNLSTPMKKSTRLKSLSFLLGLFLLLNVSRIISFAIIFSTKGYEAFNVAHISFWYFGSTILVAVLWFVNVYLFKINTIPVYTDLKTMAKHIRGNK